MSDLKDFLEPILWLSVCVYHEARGEEVEGQIAIAHAILNRVDRRDLSVKEIVLQPWQFSWANIMVIEGEPLPPISNYEAFLVCQTSVMRCFAERLKGKDLLDADHYYNPKYASPSWAKSMKLITTIGDHIFLRS